MQKRFAQLRIGLKRYSRQYGRHIKARRKKTPGQMSEVPVTIEALAEKAEEYLYEASLTPEEYEALKQSVA